MSDLIPDVWDEVSLGDNAHIKARIGWRGLSSSEYTEAGPYLIAGTHIRGESVDWDNCHHINKFRYDESPEIQLKEMDVIISKDGTIGRVGFVENMPGPATINGTMMLIRPDDSFYSKFIYFYLQGNEFQKVVKEKVSGSSVPHIFQRDMITLRVPLPPFPEQQKIAAILTSVDEVIEKTQAQCDKLKDLKTAMMQTLLTKGVGIGGNPHTEFKDSPVGRIPKGWEVCTIESILTDIIDYRGKAPPKSKAGIPLITAKNIRKGYINEDPKEYIYADKYDCWMVRGMPKFGDVFITTEAPLGNVARVPSYKFAIGQRVLTLRPDTMIICTDFLLLIMQSEGFRKELELQSTGSTVAGIKQSTFRKIFLPIPSIKEQKIIAKNIDSVILRTDVIDKKLIGLKGLKKALMQDLLTGKVRVTVPTPSSAKAS